MLIPKQFKLGGFTWKVVFRKRLKGRYGECSLAKQTIYILDGLSPEMTEQTFCHELIHAIYFAMGVNQEDHHEQTIDGFATFLHQYFNTAVYDNSIS